jgi:LmbE family N-acetylglucosaminyl deacetylase
MVTAIAGDGTPEAVWRAGGLDRLPLLDLPRPAAAVVVAPHPDDEVLGAGGLLAGLCSVGVPVHLVAATDGEGSHPASTALGPEELVRRRRAETDQALALLGVHPVRTLRCGLPDSGLAAHEDALADAVAALLAELRAELAAEEPLWCLATWRGDGHPDHEAAGRAAARAAARTGARLLEFPVWTWHWSRPDDPAVPWERARAVPLPEGVARAKERAAAVLTTQVEPLGPADVDAPVLTAPMLRRWLRPFEVVLA